MRWLGRRTRIVIEASVPIFDSDARRGGGPSPPRVGDAEPPDPETEAARRLHRRLRVAAWNFVFFAGVVIAVVGRGGYVDLMRYRAERVEARARLAEQRAKVDALRQEVARLRVDPLAKERIAREQLGLAPKGEIQFLLPKAPPRPEDLDPLAPSKP